MFSQSLCFSPAVSGTGKLNYFHASTERKLVFGRNGRNKAFAAFLTATVENFTALCRCHTAAETMRASAFDFARLISAFH